MLVGCSLGTSSCQLRLQVGLHLILCRQRSSETRHGRMVGTGPRLQSGNLSFGSILIAKCLVISHTRVQAELMHIQVRQHMPCILAKASPSHVQLRMTPISPAEICFQGASPESPQSARSAAWRPPKGPHRPPAGCARPHAHTAWPPPRAAVRSPSPMIAASPHSPRPPLRPLRNACGQSAPVNDTDALSEPWAREHIRVITS